MKKVVVITGTSSGVGLELALLLAKHDYIVYATMRDLTKQSELQQRLAQTNLVVNVKALDITNITSINQCISSIIQAEGVIDYLINNAGAGFVKSTEEASHDEINWVTDTNYLSVVRCTKAVIPQMRKQRSGHIINVSSIGGLVGQPFNELYCAAKFAVEGYTESMASYLTQAFNINFSLVEPGGILSHFAKNVFATMNLDNESQKTEYQEIFKSYMDTMQQRASIDKSLYQTPQEVAQVILNKVMLANPIPVRVRTSTWSEDMCSLKTSSDTDGLKLKRYVEQNFLGIN